MTWFLRTLQEKIQGTIVVSSKSDISHNGIALVMEGSVNLQLSAKSVGLFEAFYNSLKPVQLINTTLEVAPSGKLPAGTTELPFELPLKAKDGLKLYETYHGVFVNIQYTLKVDMQRPMLAKTLTKTIEFIMENEVLFFLSFFFFFFFFFLSSFMFFLHVFFVSFF
jgi:hypothetical protein